jgi:HK97 family phage major capsid protein
MTQLSEIADEVGKIGAAWGEFRERWDSRADQMDGIERRLNRLDLNNLFSAGIPVDAKFSRYGDARLKDDGYPSAFSEYLRRPLSGLTSDIQSKLSVGSDSEGGFFVPPEFSQKVAKKIFEISPLRQIASVQILPQGDTLEGIADVDEPAAGWVSEIGSRPETAAPTIQKWSIPLHEMYAQPKATQKLVDDAAIDIEQWIVEKIAKRFARLEGAAFVSGDGIGKPRGFLDYPTSSDDDDTRPWGTVQHIATGAAGAFDTISGLVADDANPLVSMVYSLKDEYQANAVWLMSRSSGAAIRRMRDANGVWLWQPSMQLGQPDRLLGYPVVFAADMPEISSDSLSVAFGDFEAGYQVVERPNFTMLRDPFTEKPFIKFYAARRVGGALINTEAVKLLRFSAS